MRARGLIIAIDGPAGAGKTTAARNLAKRLNYVYLDTGATFRAVAWKALEQRVALDDADRLEGIAGESEIRFGGPSNERIFIDEEDITARIRERIVADAASRVAIHPGVRRHLTRLWRSIGEQGGVVVEGRDIGTVVFPDAELKFFLVADQAVRAERRFRERAGEPGVTPELVGEELAKRDEADRARRYAPLVQAPDAIRLDTTGNTPAETLEKLEREARARLEASGHGPGGPANKPPPGTP